MLLISIFRSILFAFQSFWRNIWLSLATIFIIFLTLISVNFLVMINAVSNSTTAAVKEKIDVSVYFKPEVREKKINEIKSHLETTPEVKKISYKSPEENLEQFRQRHQDDQVIQETLDELKGNPLGGTLIIKAKELSQYPEILKAVDNPAYSDFIEEKSYDDHQLVISRINSITDNVKKGGYLVSGIFAIIAVLIVFNTVRIALFTHRGEIAIMKLVGASNWFIRSPFVVESIILAVIATIITGLVVYPLLIFTQPYLAGFFPEFDFNIVSYFNRNFLAIFGGQLVAIILLNIVSSGLALGRYLKV